MPANPRRNPTEDEAANRDDAAPEAAGDESAGKTHDATVNETSESLQRLRDEVFAAHGRIWGFLGAEASKALIGHANRMRAGRRRRPPQEAA